MAMLRHIPRHPRKIDTNALLHQLETAGYDISIQRDLNDLSSILPLVSDSGRPQDRTAGGPRGGRGRPTLFRLISLSSIPRRP